MDFLRRSGQALFFWVFCGAIFALFVVGYVFFGLLWGFRFVQGRKVAAAIFFLAAVLALSSGTAYYLLFPLHRPHQPVTIVIAKNCRVRGVADSLARHGVVTSRIALIAWLKLTGIDRQIQAGQYLFLTNEGVLLAARRLTHAKPIEKEVTIPEGLTIEQTASRIAGVLPIDTARFFRACSDTDLIRNLGLAGATTLEGYLFPDTYRFQEDVSAEEIVRRMAGRFSEEYAKIGAAADSGGRLSQRDIVILASIVEKEAVLDSERARIAGVFCNRLRRGEPLGADPTVRYILKKFDGPLFVSELSMDSPYNTRRFKGLPPGPICSPGLASIRAAVSPLRTKELYFVAKWDGSGGHDFSVSNAEHTRKKLKIRQQNRQRLQSREVSCRK